MYSTIWTRKPGVGPRQTADWSKKSHWVNFANSGDPNGSGLPAWPVFSNADNKVLYIGDPVTVGAVPNIDSLKILDAVYTTVRGKAFAAR